MTPLEQETVKIYNTESKKVGCVVRKYDQTARRNNAVFFLRKSANLGLRDAYNRFKELIGSKIRV